MDLNPVQTVSSKLAQAGIKFTTETFLSNFYGTRFIFESRRDAIKAEKKLGRDFIVRKSGITKEWYLEIF